MLIALVVAAGCSIGPRASRHVIARGPAGAPIRILLAHRPHSGDVIAEGELLAVSDSGFWVVLDKSQPAWASFGVVLRAELAMTGSPAYDGPEPPPPGVKEQFRFASRMPQGMTPALLAQVLAAYGRDSVRVIRP